MKWSTQHWATERMQQTCFQNFFSIRIWKYKVFLIYHPVFFFFFFCLSLGIALLLSHPTFPFRQISGRCRGPLPSLLPPPFWGSSGRDCVVQLAQIVGSLNWHPLMGPVSDFLWCRSCCCFLWWMFISSPRPITSITTHVIPSIKTPYLRIPAANFSPTRDLTLEMSKYFHKSLSLNLLSWIGVWSLVLSSLKRRTEQRIPAEWHHFRLTQYIIKVPVSTWTFTMTIEVNNKYSFHSIATGK